MGMSTGGKGGQMADINVTPLVDVMLVLLIIFMVTAPMITDTSGVEVDLPRSEAPPLNSEDDTQLVLSITKDGQIWIGDYAYAADEVPDKLAAVAKANPDQPVFLRADGAVPYAQIAALLGVAKRAGMVRVGLVFEPGVPELGQDGG